MIYLIRSSEVREKEDGTLDFFLSLKIGYTSDETPDIMKNKRLLSIFVNNRSIKLLATIPNATEEHEKKLHFKFRDLLWEGNEWFYYNQSIIDYIKNVTLEELNSLPFPTTNSRIRVLFAKKMVSEVLVSVDILTKQDKVDNYIDAMIKNIGKKINKKENVINYIKNDPSINKDDIEKFLLFDTKANPKVKEIQNNNVVEFLRKFWSNNTLLSRMKLLCENNLSKDELELALTYIPDGDDSKTFYNKIGPKRLKELGYNITYIKKDLVVDSFDKDKLAEEIYNNFNVGDKLLLSDIKQKLSDIYNKLGYDKSPKATDLLDYFEVKTILINEKDKTAGKLKRSRGYELISKKVNL